MATQSVTAGLLRFEDFDLDMRTGELRRHGVLVKLQPQPAKVLLVLASHPGEIVSRQELARRVWGSETFVDFEQGLNFAIRQVRTALDDNPEHPRFLETLPKRGYRFIAPVSESESSPEIALPLRSLTPLPTVAKAPRSFKIPILITALVITLLGVSYWSYRSSHSHAPQIQSVAVLPLHNLSLDPEQEYFSDGMTDELITELARVGKLRVTSHTSVEHYKKTNLSLPQIAQELGVDAVVEGSVMRSGNRVRITAQLIDGRSDRHLWAESYERDLRDILPLQIEVAQDISKHISSKLVPDQDGRLANARPVNPEAFDAYFKGRYFWNKRTEPDMQKALAYFKEAIDKDPNYADAYVGLADCYLSSSSYSLFTPQEGYPLAKTAALKALEIDTTLADAYEPLGVVKAEYDWDLAGAEQDFKKAIALNPNNTRAHQFYAEDVLEPEGRNDEAIHELAVAQQLDPSLLMTRAAAGFAYFLARKYDRAIQQEKETIELDRSFPKAHQVLGRVYAQQGKFAEAIAEFQTAINLDANPAFVADLGHAYALAGKKKEAMDALQRLSTMSAHMYVHPYSVALIYVALGDKNKAFEWLEKGRKERCWTLIYLKVDPRLDPLRSDPRFQNLSRRAGIIS